MLYTQIKTWNAIQILIGITSNQNRDQIICCSIWLVPFLSRILSVWSQNNFVKIRSSALLASQFVECPNADFLHFLWCERIFPYCYVFIIQITVPLLNEGDEIGIVGIHDLPLKLFHAHPIVRWCDPLDCRIHDISTVVG